MTGAWLACALLAGTTSSSPVELVLITEPVPVIRVIRQDTTTTGQYTLIVTDDDGNRSRTRGAIQPGVAPAVLAEIGFEYGADVDAELTVRLDSGEDYIQSASTAQDRNRFGH